METIIAYATGEGLDADDVGSIKISGGNLNITTTGPKGHGIKTSSDDLGEKGTIIISGGTIAVTTAGVASKAINSDGDVTISGGNLTLNTLGSAYYDSDEKDTSSAAGIKCEGNLLIKDGVSLSIKSSGAGGKGINVGGTITMDGGTVDVVTTGAKYGTNSSNNGMPGSNNTSSATSSSPKGIKADGNITINNGICTVNSAYHEGIESATNITINGGTVESTAYDDGLNVSNSGGTIVINGGYVYVHGANNNLTGSNGGGGSTSKLGDGIDSNGSITISGGLVVVVGGASPDEAFDCEGTFYVNGGTTIGVGGQHSCLPATSSKQYTVAYGGGSLSSGGYIQFKNASGEALITYKLARTYSDMKMILSHPDLKNGSYTLVKGGTYTGGTEVFHGYYTGGTYSGGTSTSVTINSTLTKVGNLSGIGGGNRP